MYLQKVHLKENPEQKANPISRLFLFWLIPFFKKGARKTLTLEDVPQCLPEDKSERLGQILEQGWNFEITQAGFGNRQPKLWKVVWRYISVKYCFIGLGYLFDELVLRSIQPLALRSFIQTFSVKDSEDSYPHGPHLRRDQCIFAGMLVLTSFCHALCLQTLHATVGHLGMKARLGVSSLIYKKILKLGKSDGEQANVGKLCNLLSTDVAHLNGSLILVHFFWISPIQLAFHTYLLWNELGVACFAGVACAVLILPWQIALGRFSMHFRARIAKRTDERGTLLHEIIQGIRLIKMYAWETPFANKIAQLREMEVKYIQKSLYFRGVYVSGHAIAIKLIPFCALVTYVALGNTLTADKAFFSIAIFSIILQTGMHRIPTAASVFGEMLASLNRIETFLMCDENAKKRDKHMKNYIFGADSNTKSGGDTEKKRREQTGLKPKIVMKNHSTSWTEKQEVLRNLNINLSGNKLVMVVGHVGSGKSSLLNAILGELPIATDDKNSYCHVQGTLSYASQEAWIFPASIRENILFGREMDEKRYWKVVKMCCLDQDIEEFQNGDFTLVGEKGLALSGGQRTRLSLARAIYQNAEIYLLDDPLSAVDTRVSKKLFQNCIQKHLGDSLRILATHQLQYLPMADYVIVLNREGTIWFQGTYEQLKEGDVDLSSLTGSNYDVFEDKPDSKTETRSAESDISGVSKTANNATQEKEEGKTVSSVQLGTYFRYFQAGGSYWIMSLIFLGFLITQGLYNCTDYWLSIWTNDAVHPSEQDGDNTKNNKKFYIYVYCTLVAAFTVSTLFRSVLLFRYCVQIGVNLHKKMFRSVVRAPVKFFDDNPSGRVMNRFTKDLNQIDESLPVAFYDFAQIVHVFFGMLAINIVANYYTAVPSAILVLVLWKLRGFYLATAMDLKRLEAISKSPLLTHVTMTFQGLATIRALNAQSRMLQQFEKIQDTHSAVHYMTLRTSQLFAIWLELMSMSFLSTVCTGFLILATSSNGGNVGVAISAILGLTGSLQWGIRQSAETNNFMICVERIFEYCNLKYEAPLIVPEQSVPSKWPNSGCISFQDVCLAYDDPRENLVLKNITFSTQPREKIGIVGRTGAGKSSLVTALFRLTEPCGGSITIDNVLTKNIGLCMLRSHISIIPQDPVLFTGTLRGNLDPFDEFSDEHLWGVLREVDLHHSVKKLDFPVADGGTNFSVGQRQLICLARAILRNNRILVLDEATANVDPATDQLVQQTIRRKFSECTVLIIAHRLQTVLECDRIMVLNKGRIIEFDRPEVLRKNERGALYALLSNMDVSR